MKCYICYICYCYDLRTLLDNANNYSDWDQGHNVVSHLRYFPFICDKIKAETTNQPQNAMTLDISIHCEVEQYTLSFEPTSQVIFLSSFSLFPLALSRKYNRLPTLAASLDPSISHPLSECFYVCNGNSSSRGYVSANRGVQSHARSWFSSGTSPNIRDSPSKWHWIQIKQCYMGKQVKYHAWPQSPWLNTSNAYHKKQIADGYSETSHLDNYWWVTFLRLSQAV